MDPAQLYHLINNPEFKEPVMSWTQPQCASCYKKENPGKRPVSVNYGYADQEVCCTCGQYTQEGIYISKDPNLVPYPRKDKE